MVTKLSSLLSVLHFVLLALVLAVTGLAAAPSATAGCTPEATRTIVDPHCCSEYPLNGDRTAQDQICNADGIWVDVGYPYCKTAPFCMLWS
jgi:hypothetical protein